MACSKSCEKRIRKGQIYSLMSVLIMIPLLLFMIFYLTYSQNASFDSFEKIISDQIHDVASDMENDFEKAIKISGKRALIAAANEVLVDGQPLSDSLSAVEELMLNGSLEGEKNILMHNNTLDEWQVKIRSVPSGFETNLSFSDMVIRDYNGFSIAVDINLYVYVGDRNGVAKIDRDIEKTVLVSLYGLEDVIFALNTNGFVPRKISFYPYEYFAKKVVTGTGALGECSGNVTFNSSDSEPSGKILVTNDASGVSGFAGVVSEGDAIPSVSCYIVEADDAIEDINNIILESGYDEIFLDETSLSAWSLPIKTALSNKNYFHFIEESGPGIFDRLEENLSDSRNAMETFVNVPELISAGISIKTGKTVVAYKYFSGQTINGDTVRGLPSWFRIDSESSAKYGLEGLMD